MSSTKFPCGCKVEYDINDIVVNIKYCSGHQKLYNSKMSLDSNALNLEDEIFDEFIETEFNDD